MSALGKVKLISQWFTHRLYWAASNNVRSWKTGKISIHKYTLSVNIVIFIQYNINFIKGKSCGSEDMSPNNASNIIIRALWNKISKEK